MNFSKVSKQSKLILIAVSLIIATIVAGLVQHCKATDSHEEPTAETTAVTTSEPITEVVRFTSMGEFRLTAYCACYECCEEYALNRPLDENGKPIVYTANMSVAKQGVTIAADTSVLPFGTKVVIGGNEYTVQDRGGAIKGNRIDIYFEDHNEADKFGVQYVELFKKGGVDVYYTDDPVADYERYSADQQAEIEKLPKCDDCGEHIQDDEAYHIHDMWICEDCMETYKKRVEPNGC